MTASAWRVALALAISTTLVAPLGAHMKLTKAAPAANTTLTTSPRDIQIWFTEAPDLKVSKLELSGPDGKVVTLSTPHAMPDKSLMAGLAAQVGDGIYTVRWQSAGTDGHVLKGEYKFTLKRAP